MERRMVIKMTNNIDKTVEDVIAELNDDQKKVLYYLISRAKAHHVKPLEDINVKKVFDTFTDEQKTVAYAMIGAALTENE